MTPCPPADSLPEMVPSNPWRSARYALEDFERYPPHAQLPYCYVRLSDEALVREDMVPKETVILTREQAQTTFLRFARATNYLNTRISPMKGGYTMFTTPEQEVNPFATEMAEAVSEASLEDKKPSSLKEEEPTSLLFPSISGIWSEAAATFSVGQFKIECASTKIDDELPRFPDRSMAQSEGANLSPIAPVQATLDAASFSNQSLRERWGLSYKRRVQDHLSSPGKSGKRVRGTYHGRGNS